MDADCPAGFDRGQHLGRCQRQFCTRSYGSICSLFDRNDVALTCKGFWKLERSTRKKLRLRRSVLAGLEFLAKLKGAGFKNVIDLDLSIFKSRVLGPSKSSKPWEYLKTAAKAFGKSIPSVVFLTVPREMVMVPFALAAWPRLRRLEIKECQKGTEDPFFMVRLEDVLDRLPCLEELSLIVRTSSKHIREPFGGFVLRYAGGEVTKQYPGLKVLRNCFFATDQSLSVLGKALPNLASLELINYLLDRHYSEGTDQLTSEGMRHLLIDYSHLTSLRISGNVMPEIALEKSEWLDHDGEALFYAFCNCQLKALSLEGPLSVQLGLRANNAISSCLTRLHLEWSGFLPHETKSLSKLGSVRSLTEVTLRFSNESTLGTELQELVSMNRNLRHLQLSFYQGMTLDSLAFIASNAQSLVSLTFGSPKTEFTLGDVLSCLAPARTRLEKLSLQVWVIEQVRGGQEAWPSLKDLALEIYDAEGEEVTVADWLQSCHNLESRSYKRLLSPTSINEIVDLSALTSLTSLRHFEVRSSLSRACIELVMTLTQLRSVVLWDTFENPLEDLSSLKAHPNLRSLMLNCSFTFEDYGEYLDHTKSVELSSILEPLLESTRLEQVKSNFDIWDLSPEFEKRFQVASL